MTAVDHFIIMNNELKNYKVNRYFITETHTFLNETLSAKDNVTILCSSIKVFPLFFPLSAQIT